MTDKTGKITREELIEMFGEELPLDAVKLIFDTDRNKTVDDIRAGLRAIAEKQRIAPDKTAVEAMARAVGKTPLPDGTLVGPIGKVKLAQAALGALKANGFAVVPVEPTEAMRLEGVINFGDVRNIYRAMIAAAQGRE